MASTKQYFSAAGKPIRCKAAVARKAGEPLVIEEVIVAPPKAHEVRLKIICTSLCYTDIILWRMKEFPGCFPRILGHEAFGVVESVGEEVDEFKEGDSVVPIFLPDCMDVNPRKATFVPNSHFKRLRCCIEMIQADSLMLKEKLYIISCIYQIDPEIPPNRACVLSCGVSTGVGAAWKTSNVEPGSTVVIFGLGSIGLAVAEGARLCGATRIIGVDINSNKFEIGKQFGITEFVNSKSCGDKPISQVIIEMTNGGADYCFECVGLATLVQEAFTCCRKGWGKTVVLGVDKPDAQLNLNSFEVLQSQKTLTGALFGGLKPKSDVPILVKRYLDKELQLDKFVTHEVSFEDINKAFDLLIQGKSLRCVIWMDKL
ncbi:hypothetical protein KY289_021954 [Solanum tuberosum]|nr:hypothetical protein KY289_021954 [Solanum tuberosum]